MKACVLLMLIAAVAFPITVFAAGTEDYFPMDNGMSWGFDDGSVMKIEGFRAFEMPESPGATQMTKVQAFAFTTYANQARMMFRTGTRVYEWQEGFRRLWYDFGRGNGSSWQFEWEDMRGQSGISDEKITLTTAGTDPGNGGMGGSGSNSGSTVDGARGPDTMQGAAIRVMARNQLVATPAGRFENCIQFRIERPDEGVVDEWFAPGVGLVQRAFTAAEGVRMMQLVRFNSPEQLDDSPLRLTVRLDKQVYEQGEPVEIQVDALNMSDSDVTLTFPSGLQADYSIDRAYSYSESHDFTQAETSVVIPARGVYSWTFPHTGEDYAVPPGRHTVTAGLAGTGLTAAASFSVTAVVPELPAGITIAASTTKTQYQTGEPVDFSLTATNSGGEAVKLTVPLDNPLLIDIPGIVRLPGLFAEHGDTGEITIPAGGSHTFTVTLDAERLYLKPGIYDVLVGINGYKGTAPVTIEVTSDSATGTLSGLVVIRTGNGGEQPVGGVTVTLRPETPRSRMDEFGGMAGGGGNTWSVTTGADGAYRFENVPLGQFYSLHASKAGHVQFNATIRMVEAEATFRFGLTPNNIRPQNPLNYKTGNAGDLFVAFGTDKGAYAPTDSFTAYMKVTNRGGSTAGFTFEGEQTLNITIRGADNEVVWSSAGSEKAASTAVQTVDIAPGETHLFVYEGSFDGIVPVTPVKYTFEGSLAFASTTASDLATDQMSGFVRVMIVTAVQERIRTQSSNGEMVVDAREQTRARIEIQLRDNDVAGDITVSEIRSNVHDELQNRRFVKMVEIDADPTIRACMDTARVRIYYDDSDFGADFDPLKLSVGHWHDSLSLETDSEPAWQMLQTSVNTTERYVEAITTEFSSFALFEDSVETSVEDDSAKPSAFSLGQNSPNPFNPATSIEFTIPDAGFVELTVYNAMGQIVTHLVDRSLPAGTHRAVFDGSRLASGVYFYRLAAPGYVQTRKMMLIK